MVTAVSAGSENDAMTDTRTARSNPVTTDEATKLVRELRANGRAHGWLDGAPPEGVRWLCACLILAAAIVAVPFIAPEVLTGKPKP